MQQRKVAEEGEGSGAPQGPHMGMRLQKGCKVQCSSFAPQTVRKLLEEKRQRQATLVPDPGHLVHSVTAETSHPAQSPFQGPTGASKREGPTPGQTAAHEYPIAPLSAWQPNTSDQATFPGYRSLESSKNCLLQPPGAQCDMMGHHMAPLETSVYGAPETGAADEVYGSKMMTMADYKKSVPEEATTLNFYPLPGGTWLGQEQAGPCPLPSGNHPAMFVEMDPGELAQAQAEIQNMELAQLLQQDEDGDLLLHLLVAQGFRPLAYAAAEILRVWGQLDAKEHKGKTPLLVAAAANQPEIVKDLIMLGADVNAADQKGQTVLHLGATYGLPNVIAAVMVAGIPANMEARNFEGLTPLHCAVISHNAAFQAQRMEPLRQHHLQDLLLCIQLLLQLRADYKSQDLKSSKTILHLAIQAGNLPLIQFLFQWPGQELQTFVNMKAHGNTALHMAAGLHGHPFQEQIVHLLLQHWADPSARNLENEQPVHLLAPGPASEHLRLLLRSRRPVAGPAHLSSLP